ncbi:MAG: adenosine deaminase [Candidatus Cloacimonetes bacterium]|nr:adenosine deaminase [Candidatus Cloacimonadota bacterium]
MRAKNYLKKFIEGIPKAELHLHIEGTFEPELMFKIAKRNGVNLDYKNIEELKRAYNFSNLQEFLNIYYAGCNVLINEVDFYDMTWEYLKKAKEQNILHTEIMFDPQTHTDRGIMFATVITGIHKALTDAKIKLGITSKLIMSFLRHLPEDSAFETLGQAVPFKDWIDAVGLDSSELGHPPSKFERVFQKAKEEGYLIVAHAGEEGPAEYVTEALELLQVDRIDHGNRCLEDIAVVNDLVERRMALTVCPLSNLKLRVVEDLTKHPLKEMLDKGLFVTINSDDPAYFGGYINENYIEIQNALDLSKEDIIQLAGNSFKASFLNKIEKSQMMNKLKEFTD